MKTVKNTILALGVSIVALCSAQALAADTPAAAQTFGIVDMNKVLQDTEVAKNVFSQMESKRKEYLTLVSKEEDALLSIRQELEKGKGTLSKEVLEEKQKAFEEKYQHWLKLGQRRKVELDIAFEDAMNQMRRKAAEVVAAEAKQRKYSAVFTQNAVMMSTPDLDLTEVVIEQMNKTAKKISIDWAAAAKASEAAFASKDSKKK
jgi:outer membrane protein